MSYCRWSSDQYQCDVYAYDTGPLIIIHVASNRYVLADGDTLPEEVNIADASPEEYLAYNRELSDVLSRADLVPIGLPFDGESFTEAGPAAAYERLVSLREAGYRVTQSALDALAEEASTHG